MIAAVFFVFMAVVGWVLFLLQLVIASGAEYLLLSGVCAIFNTMVAVPSVLLALDDLAVRRIMSMPSSHFKTDYDWTAIDHWAQTQSSASKGDDGSLH